MIGLLASALLGLALVSAEAPSDGVIEGRLVNGTTNQATLGGVTVTLATYANGSWSGERTTTTDSDGQFLFDGLGREDGVTYLPVVHYDGAWYFTAQPITLPEAGRAQAEIMVYDGTRSDQALRYERAAMLVAGIGAEALSVMEMTALENAAQRTYLGDSGSTTPRPVTVRFPLPTGAVGLEPRFGLVPAQLTPLPEGFGTTWPVAPGRHELAYSYQLPYAQGQAIIDRAVAYPTSTLTLYLPDVGLQVSSDTLTAQGTTDMGGQRYRLYSANDLERGARVTVRIAGLAGSSSLVAGVPAAVPIGLGLGMIGSGLILAYWWRGRGVASEPSGNAEQLPTSQFELDERHQLVVALAELDEAFDSGKVDAERYGRQRATWRARLLELTRQPASTSKRGARRNTPG